jgi:hypothetical protein
MLDELDSPQGSADNAEQVLFLARAVVSARTCPEWQQTELFGDHTDYRAELAQPNPLQPKLFGLKIGQ